MLIEIPCNNEANKCNYKTNIWFICITKEKCIINKCAFWNKYLTAFFAKCVKAIFVRNMMLYQKYYEMVFIILL